MHFPMRWDPTLTLRAQRNWKLKMESGTGRMGLPLFTMPGSPGKLIPPCRSGGSWATFYTGYLDGQNGMKAILTEKEPAADTAKRRNSR